MKMCLLYALLVPATFATADWASFRGGPLQTGVTDEALPSELGVIWEVESKDGFTGTPAIVDDRVFVGALSGDLLCLNLANGSEVWRFQTPEETGFRPGFNAAPTVWKETVFIGDEDGAFYAVSRESGELRWKYVTDDQIVGGATVIEHQDGDRVLVGSHDGTLVCLNASSGEAVWTFQTDGPVNCSVAVAETEGGRRTFVTGCDELFRVIDVDRGKEVGQAPTGSPLIASPAVVGDKVYFGSYAGAVRSLDFATLKDDWLVKAERSSEPIHSSAAVTDELVIVGGRDRTIRAFNRDTGEERWRVTTRSKIDSSPVVAPVRGGGERAYVGTNDKRILGIDTNSGDVVWEHRVSRSVSGSAAIASGRLVIGTEGPNGKLLCFGAE